MSTAAANKGELINAKERPCTNHNMSTALFAAATALNCSGLLSMCHHIGFSLSNAPAPGRAAGASVAADMVSVPFDPHEVVVTIEVIDFFCC